MTREETCTLCPLSFLVIENLPEKSPKGIKVRLAPVTMDLTRADGSGTQASFCTSFFFYEFLLGFFRFLSGLRL